LRFQSGPTEAARIDSSGRLLVGTSTASAVGGTGQASIQLNAPDSGFSCVRKTNDIVPGIISLGKARSSADAIVQSNDNLGLIRFAGSDGVNLQSYGAQIGAAVDGTPGTNNIPGRLVFSTTPSGSSSPTERMRIQNTGTVLVGKTADDATSPGISFLSSGLMRCIRDNDATAVFHRNSSNGDVIFLRRDTTNVGSISVTTTATAYNTSSDYRLKENVVPLTGAIDRLQQIPVHRFNFIADPDTVVDGFIAHEAQEIVPECVTGTKDEVDENGDPVYQGIDQSKLVPLLTAALQEAIAEIASLKDRVAALEAL